MSEQHNFRRRKPRNANPDPNSKKPTIISDILSTNENSASSANKKKHFSTASFRGLGCTAAPQVSVPSVIRASASWEPAANANTIIGSDKSKKKRLKDKKIDFTNSSSNITNGSFAADNAVTSSQPSSLSLALSSSCVGAPDVWCGSGVGLTTDAASVDGVFSAPRVRQWRPKLDGTENTVLGRRERSYPVRRMSSTPEDIHFPESEAASAMPRGARYHRHLRNNHFRDGIGLSEIMMLRGDVRMGERPRRLDVYRDMRLDVDNMSYEELVELGERIGHVSTGLGEDEVSCCLRRTNYLLMASEGEERKCSICQEEYEADDEMGKLCCAHSFHIECIKHWLARKNMCPICKTKALPQS